eukprot:scaffold220488_cov17-Tisochrysis_lutea.AAC.1
MHARLVTQWLVCCLEQCPPSCPQVLSDKWDRPYSREKGAFPAPWVRQAKFWPTHSRVKTERDRFMAQQPQVMGRCPSLLNTSTRTYNMGV